MSYARSSTTNRGRIKKWRETLAVEKALKAERARLEKSHDWTGRTANTIRVEFDDEDAQLLNIVYQHLKHFVEVHDPCGHHSEMPTVKRLVKEYEDRAPVRENEYDPDWPTIDRSSKVLKTLPYKGPYARNGRPTLTAGQIWMQKVVKVLPKLWC